MAAGKHTLLEKIGIFATIITVLGGGLFWAGNTSGRLDTLANKIEALKAIEIEKRLTRIETKLDQRVTSATSTTQAQWLQDQRFQSELWSAYRDPAWPEPTVTGLTPR